MNKLIQSDILNLYYPTLNDSTVSIDLSSKSNQSTRPTSPSSSDSQSSLEPPTLLDVSQVNHLIRNVTYLSFEQQPKLSQLAASGLQKLRDDLKQFQTQLELCDLYLQRMLQSAEHQLRQTVSALECLVHLFNWPEQKLQLWSPMTEGVFVRVRLDRAHLKFSFQRDNRLLRTCAQHELPESITLLQQNQTTLRSILAQLSSLQSHVQQKLHLLQVNLVNLRNFKAKRLANKFMHNYRLKE